MIDKKTLFKKITSEIESTKTHIEELKEQTKPVKPENSLGRVSRMDAINNKSVNEATLRVSEEKLRNLNYALSKIDDKDFGICVQCKKPIPEGRLMLMPQAVKCVNCA